MRIRSPKDFWSGIFFVATALAFILLSLQYNLGTMHRMGPALFPIIVAALLGAIGLVITSRSLVFEGPPVPELQLRPVGISLAAIVLFGLALNFHGIVAAIMAVVIVGSFASRESRLVSSIALAAVLTVFSVAVFVWLLGLPIQVWPE
jgi:hypothetical protein